MIRLMFGIVGFVVLGASPSYGQSGASAALNPAMRANAMGNPYMNPYANPFINPYANPYGLGMAPGPGMGGVYAFSAVSNATGIGSGIYSGTRGAAPPAPVARSENASSYGQPGASASRYFQGVYGPTQGVERYYGRYNRRFSSNRQSP